MSAVYVNSVLVCVCVRRRNLRNDACIMEIIYSVLFSSVFTIHALVRCCSVGVARKHITNQKAPHRARVRYTNTRTVTIYSYGHFSSSYLVRESFTTRRVRDA